MLLEEARHSATGLRSKPNPLSPEEELVRRGRQAEKFVQGEVSRARQASPTRLSEAIPKEVSRFWPQHLFELDEEKHASNLRSAPRGSAADLAGDTNEHHNVLLDEEATLLIIEAAEHLSKADLPTEIADALAMGALTALMKDNGHIRSIVHFPLGSGAHDGTTMRHEV